MLKFRPRTIQTAKYGNFRRDLGCGEATNPRCSNLLTDAILERFIFGFQYIYLNLPFSQSDVSDLSDEPIKLFNNREKVAVEEVKSEPLHCWGRGTCVCEQAIGAGLQNSY